MIVMIKLAKAMRTMSSWNSSSYVTTFTPTTPFQSGQGVKKDHPLKRGNNRLPCYGSARFPREPSLFYQNPAEKSKHIFEKPAVLRLAFSCVGNQRLVYIQEVKL